MLSYYQLSPLSIFSFPDPPNICLGDSIVLEGSNGFSHYWWSDINGDIINTDDRLVITPDSDTWYLLTAKDTNDCVVKEDIIIYVDSCVNSSLSFYSSELTKIFPNPVINNLTINHASIFNNVKIYNIFGYLLLEKEMLSFRKKTELNLQNLPTGVYYVHLYANHLLIKKKSFIKVLE